jgi:iron(III) transport system substrate-binding protein
MVSSKTIWTAAASAVLMTLAQARAQGVDMAYATKELKLPAEVVEAACKEGQLTLYSLIFGGKAATMHPKFRERFPCIKMDVFSASGGALSQRFTSEFQASTRNADLVMNSSPVTGERWVQAKMFMSWTPPTANLVPATWQRPGYWYAVGLTYLGTAWNTQEVTPEENAWLAKATTWDDMLNSPFKNRMAMVDVRAGGTTQLAYYYFKHVLGANSWKKLADQHPTMFNGINPLADRLAAGEFAFVPHATVDTAIATRWAQGAPLRWKFPEPGLAVPYFIGIASNAPHPNAAKIFLAWSLSPEGQSNWVSESGLAPVSEHAIDNRRFAKESWYKLPNTVYPADWSKIESDIGPMTQEFRQLFAQ